MIIDDLEIGVHELGFGDLVPPGGAWTTPFLSSFDSGGGGDAVSESASRNTKLES